MSGKSRRELLKVSWEPSERSFYLSGTVSGKCMRSTITDVGGVSYVMSPYLSRHLTTSQIASASLADRVSELEDATSNDKHVKGFSDNTLDTVRLMMIEWVPMGGNAIVALNDRLGVSERVQGGFFTAAVDKHPGATLFKGGRQGLTSVRPLDYDPYCYVNFEAEVRKAAGCGMPAL